MTGVRPEGSVAASKINPAVPQSARVWDCWLGGKDHYPADEQAADECFLRFPRIFDLARSCREFHVRMTRHLAAAGIRQFLDIGPGLPARDDGNTHEVAQRVAPECRVVYADNDPLVVAFGQGLLTSSPPGRSDCISADLGDPGALLAQARELLDFTKPVAIMATAVLGHIGDPGCGGDHAAREVARQLRQALPPGGCLAVCDLTTHPALNEALESYNGTGATPYRTRTRHQIARFLDGLQPARAGIAPEWPGWPPQDDCPLPELPAWGAAGIRP